MQTSSLPSAGGVAWRSRAEAALKAAITLAIFFSAFLLFSIQPLFTRMVLPLLGGTPAVWSVAMVFFQMLLLLGYLYAHLSATRLSSRASIMTHLALLAVTGLSLPIEVSTLLGPPRADGEALWLLGVFALSTGLPFFAIAGNGPLLQAWFSRSSASGSISPYVLYGASNLGSFSALFLYPALFEPTMRLQAQSLGWSAGFVLLTVMIGLAGALVLTSALKEPDRAGDQSAAAPADWASRARWVFYAFIPSGLLVAVTAHISTDISSGPLLWVLPLALFLLTFVLIFRDKALVSARVLAIAWPVAALALMINMFILPLPSIAGLGLHVGAFFIAAMLSHTALYAARPENSRLTEFYLWMSFGGVLGGIFAGLASPHLFNAIYEYPILIALAFLALPGGLARPSARQLAVLAALAAVTSALVAAWPSLSPYVAHAQVSIAIVVVALAAAAFQLLRATPVMTGATAAASLALLMVILKGADFEYTTRSFFGVNHVMLLQDGKFRAIVHSNTNHGAMRLRNEDGSPADMTRPTPVAYYNSGGPFETAISEVRSAHGGRMAGVGIIGLGAGGLACHSRPREAWSFYEIDPEVVRIATDRRWFNFLSACTPDARIVTGDARLTLAAETRRFDLLVLDAFSSDAIPAHLLTREAFKLYLARTAENGAMVLHISNRYMELRSVVAAIAAELGLAGMARYENQQEAEARSPNNLPAGSEVVVLARKPEHLGRLTGLPGWDVLAPRPGVEAWTDDYSNTFGAILRRIAEPRM